MTYFNTEKHAEAIFLLGNCISLISQITPSLNDRTIKDDHDSLLPVIFYYKNHNIRDYPYNCRNVYKMIKIILTKTHIITK